MKTFLDFIVEQEAAGPPKPFGHETRMKLKAKGLYAPEPSSVDTRGANSPFADPSVKSYGDSKPKMTNPEVGKQRPYVSDTKLKIADTNRKIDAGFAKVKADLDKLDNKKPATVAPDKPIVGKDDAVGKLLASKGYDRSGKKIAKPTAQTKVATRPETPEAPVKKIQTAVPIPKARPSNLKPAKSVQTFKQAFANAPEGSKFNWTDPKTGKTGTYLRKTKKTRR